MNDTHSRIRPKYTASRIDEVECPACRGAGYINTSSNCVWCKGKGVVTEEHALAFGHDD